MYTNDMKNALNLAAKAERRANFVSCPLFANVFKNNITSSVIHLIVCLLKIE